METAFECEKALARGEASQGLGMAKLQQGKLARISECDDPAQLVAPRFARWQSCEHCGGSGTGEVRRAADSFDEAVGREPERHFSGERELADRVGAAQGFGEDDLEVEPLLTLEALEPIPSFLVAVRYRKGDAVPLGVDEGGDEPS